MKILIAPDSFKNALSAPGVAKALRKGLLKVLPEAEITVVPMADGGEGTMESLIEATQGSFVHVRVHDPLMREVDASFGITGDGNTAIIEMASASGIQLIRPEERDPWITSSYGTGELIRAALDRGCHTILIGIGGSATNDGGMGMARALGMEFTQVDGKPVSEGGGALGDVNRIDTSGLDPKVKNADIIVACDVTNPLTGPEGASQVYGPQKGAGDAMVNKLDGNLAHFAGIIREQLDLDVEYIPGAGAAGGLGAGMLAFLGARLLEGFPVIAGMLGLEDKIRAADLVITGEGKLDAQTRFGKTPFGVGEIARRNGKPVIAVAGAIGEGAEILYKDVFKAMFSILDGPIPLEEAISRTPELLEKAGQNIGRLLKTGRLV